jgi:proteasome lid subunit RPN8/RPN11
MTRIILEGNSLLSIIYSGRELIETKRYGKDPECLGDLYGPPPNTLYRVEFTQPFQTAKRDKEGKISIDPKRKEDLEKGMEKLTGRPPIGDYHSHPNEDPSPSSHDMDFLKKNEDKISLILSITKELTKKHGIYLDQKNKAILIRMYKYYLMKLRGYKYENSRYRKTDITLDPNKLGILKKNLIHYL